MATIPSKQLHRAGTYDDLVSNLSQREIGFCTDDNLCYIKKPGSDEIIPIGLVYVTGPGLTVLDGAIQIDTKGVINDMMDDESVNLRTIASDSVGYLSVDGSTITATQSGNTIVLSAHGDFTASNLGDVTDNTESDTISATNGIIHTFDTKIEPNTLVTFKVMSSAIHSSDGSFISYFIKVGNTQVSTSIDIDDGSKINDSFTYYNDTDSDLTFSVNVGGNLAAQTINWYLSGTKVLK